MSSTLWRARRRGECPVIYGRDRERAQLRELLDDAIAGNELPSQVQQPQGE